jgi:hypothetical protein
MVLAIANVLINITRAAPFVSIMKVHACFFETRPEGMGLFFKLVLSISASIRSFRMYIPTAIINVMKGAATILWISSWVPVSELIKFRMPGMQNRPAIVATE